MRASTPASPPVDEADVKSEGMFSKLKRAAGEMHAAKRSAQEELERSQAEAARVAGALVTSGIFGTSTVEIYEAGYVRVAVGQRDSTGATEITKATPYEKLRSIKYAEPAKDKAPPPGSGLDGVVGSAVSSLFKGGAGLMKASVPGLAVAGVAHLASAEGRRAYLTIATDRAIHNLTNESHNGVLVKSNKAHNEVGAELAVAGMSVLGLAAATQTSPGIELKADSRHAVAIHSAAEPTLADRLREMAELHRDGILSAEEFADAKARLISGL